MFLLLIVIFKKYIFEFKEIFDINFGILILVINIS